MQLATAKAQAEAKRKADKAPAPPPPPPPPHRAAVHIFGLLLHTVCLSQRLRTAHCPQLLACLKLDERHMCAACGSQGGG